MEPPSSDVIPVLSLLDAYAQSHERASSDLKSSVWNLHKARRRDGAYHTNLLGAGSRFSADRTLREEILAHARLDAGKGDDEFALRRGAAPEGSTTTATATATDGTGLRRRRGGNEDETKSAVTTSTTTVVEEETPRTPAPTNPIELFGVLVPTDLRTAQSDAERALRFYVDAANFAAEIVRRLDATKNKDADALDEASDRR